MNEALVKSLTKGDIITPTRTVGEFIEGEKYKVNQECTPYGVIELEFNGKVKALSLPTLIDNFEVSLSIGDVVICLYSVQGFITQGREYKVIGLDWEGDPQILDDKGDNDTYLKSVFKLKKTFSKSTLRKLEEVTRDIKALSKVQAELLNIT